MDYYKEVLDEIKKNVRLEKYEEAMHLLKNELSMPYIPSAYETEFQVLQRECKQQIQSNIKTKKYDEEDIETLLQGSIDDAFIATELLRASNVREYLEFIESYLTKEPHYLIRSILIEILMEQDITSSIRLNYEGMEVEFIPTYIEPIETQKINQDAIKKIQDFFENDNPVFCQMCIEIFLKELYLKLPFQLEEDEIMYVLFSVISYVFQANGENDGFKCFIEEKNLAMYRGYDLLLNKYCI